MPPAPLRVDFAIASFKFNSVDDSSSRLAFALLFRCFTFVIIIAWLSLSVSTLWHLSRCYLIIRRAPQSC